MQSPHERTVRIAGHAAAQTAPLLALRTGTEFAAWGRHGKTVKAMGSQCERVYRDEGDIARLQRTIERLPADAHVRLRLADGSTLTGIVGERPVLQLFYGPDGREGANAVLRLERDAPGEPDARDVLIDRIVDVGLLPEASRRRPVARSATP